MQISKTGYYLFLLQKKVKIKIHNFLESKIKIDNSKSIEDFQFFLIKIIISNLIDTVSGIYFNTKVKNKNKPMTLAQARVLMGFCILYNNRQINFNDKYIIERMKKFILSLRDTSGIYKFNQKSWNLQDEGIATIWTLLALLKVYKITKEERLFSKISETVTIMNEKLVDKDNGLLHTLEDNQWCLNSLSTYAYFANQFLEFNYNEKLLINYKKAIELCVNKLTPEGFFPYSEKRHSYLLLYHPVVMYTLEKAINSKIISNELKIKTENALKKARIYLLNQMDESNFFVEPVQKKFSRYIISNVISLAALKNKISSDLEYQILKNISSYVINDRLYLCRNSDGKYFNGNHFEVNDVLTTEVFYWLLIYLYN